MSDHTLAAQLPQLTIVVSTIHTSKCINLLSSLLPYAATDQVIVIIDGAEYDHDPALHEFSRDRDNISLEVSPLNQGQSRCRNRGLTLAQHRYAVMFDDDIMLTTDVLSQYRQLFRQGYQIVGGPLRLPRVYHSMPTWLPPGLYSLVAIHDSDSTIWGGNFGFDLTFCSKNSIAFREDLGRKGGNLLSGDDTTFVRELLGAGAFEKFDPSLAVDHHVDPRRFGLAYLGRRAFWQGRTEIRRREFFKGSRKYLRRAFKVGPVGLKLKLTRCIVGAALLTSFFAGVLYEAVARPFSILWRNSTARFCPL